MWYYAIVLYNKMKSNLCLKIPDNEYPEYGQISPVKIKHPTMLYWMDKSGNFLKTNKDSGSAHERESILREEKISKLFDGKSPSSYINIPSKIINWNNKLIVSQKEYNQGDFMDYILQGNSNLNSVIIFLKSIRNILPILNRNKIIYGDFAFENFMVKLNKNNQLQKLVLVDFGQSVILNQNNTYHFNPENLMDIRPNYQSPDLFLNYKSRLMKGNELYDLLLKRDLFVIGILTLNLLTNNELWNKYTNMNDKIDDIIYIHQKIKIKMSQDINHNLKIVFKIILSLFKISLKDISNPLDLYYLIDMLGNSKKRKYS